MSQAVKTPNCQNVLDYEDTERDLKHFYSQFDLTKLTVGPINLRLLPLELIFD